MATVFLGIGSNIDAETNLSLGVGELRAKFGDIELSPIYSSPPFGFEGDDFLNLVARIDTSLSPLELHDVFDAIHEKAGRVRGCNRFLARTLDIDLLLYDQLIVDEPPIRLPRSDVLEYSFVLRPLADIAPDTVHPLTGNNYARAWAEFDASCHPLREVDVIL